MKRRGFTLVELLVVIAIIALLMGILMPALARVRQLAFRMTCGTNLSGIGKACLLYANDYDDEMPKAGGRTNTWSNQINNWLAPTRDQAYGIAPGSSEGSTSISSNFYLLVKYADVTPKQFICKSESGVTEFELADVTSGVPADTDLTDVWDFGPIGENQGGPPYTHCSYAYQHPFAEYALTTAQVPTMAIAADHNPWALEDADRDEGDVFTNFRADEDDVSPKGSKEDAERGNAEAHQSEGQNVLFLDSHVEFAKRSYVGTDQDNIYTRDVSSRRPAKGTQPYYTGEQPPASYNADNVEPRHRKDSVLLSDGPKVGGGRMSPH